MSSPVAAAADERPPAGLCSWRVAGRYCRDPGRYYLPGWRCPDHTPNALAGRPEPPPGPGIKAHREAQ